MAEAGAAGAEVPKPAPATRLAALLAGAAGPALRDVELPEPLGRAKIRLLTGAEEEEVALALGAWLRQLEADSGISHEILAATGQLALTARSAQEGLARAVRDADDPSKAFGDFEDWRGLPEVVVSDVFRRYQDLVEELDPLRRQLTKDELAAVDALVKKKDWDLLLSYGLRRLIGWLRTTADQPVDSPQARS